MKNLISFFLLFLVSLPTWSQPQDNSALKPVVEYLRTAPAWINGTIAFNGPYNLHKEGSTHVDILKGKSIFFDVQENYITLYPQAALHVEYRGVDVVIENITWTLKGGFKIKASVPADVTGLTTSLVSRKVSSILEELLSARMKRANKQLYRIRAMEEVGTTVIVVKEIIRIFNRDDSPKEEKQDLPSYRGEAGLNINPPNNQAFLLGPIRVELRQGDVFRMGFNFNGDETGIYPYSLNVTSDEGLQLNTGKEFKAAARIVLQKIDADKNGARIQIKLGATEVIELIATAAEEIAWRTGNTNFRCVNCYQIAEMPAFRLFAEGIFRQGLLKQAELYTPLMKTLNVDPAHIASFKKKETCRIQGGSCARNCRLKLDDDKKIEACIEKCTVKMNACLK